MRVYGLAAAAVVTFVAATSFADEKPDSAKLLLGRWVVTKAEEDEPVGAVVEFRATGRLKVTTKDRQTGKDVVYDGTYKLDGEKVLITLRVGNGDQVKPPATIRTVTADRLILVTEQSDEVAFERAK